MKKLIVIFLLSCLMFVQLIFAQAPAVLGIYKEVVKGQSVQITFDYPEESRIFVKFFRVRKGQTAAGAYTILATIAKTESSFTFVPVGSCHIFISAVWDETQSDGTIITKESPGSNHVQISVK